jgi:lysophospholipase L1-like esterase
VSTVTRAFACAVLGLALLSPAAAATSIPQKLFVYGDSLAVGTEPYIPDALPDWRVRQDVEVDRHIRGAARALRDRGDRLAPVVHISLGTVDDPDRPRKWRRAMRRVLRATGSERCVVWANIYRPIIRDGEELNGWEPLNKVLDEEAEHRSNLVIVDWAAMVERHLEWRSSFDATHVSERGYRARSRAVARASEECYDRLRLRGTS